VDHARLAVDSLVLTTNNTGILGPVVLEAALGPRFAPLGMLATVRYRAGAVARGLGNNFVVWRAGAMRDLEVQRHSVDHV